MADVTICLLLRANKAAIEQTSMLLTVPEIEMETKGPAAVWEADRLCRAVGIREMNPSAQPVLK